MSERNEVAARPKLTKPQMVRLVDIGNDRLTSCSECPSATARLIELGLVEKSGGKIAKTGRVVWHARAHITDAGRALLSGFPTP